MLFRSRWFILFILAIGLILIPGCTKELNENPASIQDPNSSRELDLYNQNPTPPLYTSESKAAADPMTGEIYPINMNRQILGKNEMRESSLATTSLGSWTDYSGTVQVTVYCSAHYSTFVNAGIYSHNRGIGGVTVGNDEVLVGGGAWADWFSNWKDGGTPGPEQSGVFITEAYPIDGSLTTFVAKSKDHAAYQPHVLYVYAIGLKLKQADGTWMPRNTLRNYIFYNSSTSTPSYFPTSTVQTNISYPIIGGGVKINWSTYGQLLVESRPLSNSSWKVSSRTHAAYESCSITAHCIGLYSGYIPNFGYISFSSPNPTRSPGTYVGIPPTVGVATDMLTTDPSYVPTSIGCLSTTDNNNGRLITGMQFDYGTNGRIRCTTQSKDHVSRSGGWLYTFTTQIKKAQ